METIVDKKLKEIVNKKQSQTDSIEEMKILISKYEEDNQDIDITKLFIYDYIKDNNETYDENEFKTLYKRGNEIFNYSIIKDLFNEMDYKDYLLTKHWKIISKESKLRDGNRCKVCGSNKSLVTHHRDYEHRGEEFNYMEDIVTLCFDCHNKFHDISNNNVDIKPKPNSPKTVYQYTSDGEFIKEFPSLNQAANSLNLDSYDMSLCCYGKINLVGGYSWKYEKINTDKPEKIRSKYWPKERKSVNKNKAVFQYSLNGEFIKEFKSAFDAQKETGINKISIYACSTGRAKTGAGYIWKYKKD